MGSGTLSSGQAQVTQVVNRRLECLKGLHHHLSLILRLLEIRNPRFQRVEPGQVFL